MNLQLSTSLPPPPNAADFNGSHLPPPTAAADFNGSHLPPPTSAADFNGSHLPPPDPTLQISLPLLHQRAAAGADAAEIKQILSSKLSSGAASATSSGVDATASGVDATDPQTQNTALHVAILFRHKETALALLDNGASLTSLNSEGSMPISYCEDAEILEALLLKLKEKGYMKPRTSAKVSGGGGGAPNLGHNLWLSDKASGRNILHFVSLRLRDDSKSLISDLIASADPSHLRHQDSAGDNFLAIAAKEGNLAVLEALKKSKDNNLQAPTVWQLLNDGKTGLKALMSNRREFFDEMVRSGKMKVKVGEVVGELKGEAEVVIKGGVGGGGGGGGGGGVGGGGGGKENVYGRAEDMDLEALGNSLPTYLALFAGKDEVFKLMLESRLVTENQWDDEKKGTCLHWAVAHERADIVAKLMTDRTFAHLRLSPSIKDSCGKTALQMAFEQKNQELTEIMKERAAFKEHEDKLFRDREVYVQALNAVLVGAALIGSVTFAGWLQLPPTGDPVFRMLGMKVFWGSNSVSFFTAVAAMCVTIAALLPTPTKYVGDIASQLRLNLVLAALLLAISVAAVTAAFAGAGFATAMEDDDRRKQKYGRIMFGSSFGGVGACLITLMGFMLQLFKYVPPLTEILPLMSFVTRLPFMSGFRLSVGESSRSGYPHAVVRHDFDLLWGYKPVSDSHASLMRKQLRNRLLILPPNSTSP